MILADRSRFSVASKKVEKPPGSPSSKGMCGTVLCLFAGQKEWE
jgi:hypothetical protein